MNDYRVNINYAKALFSLADEENMQQQVHEDMVLVNSVFCENHQLYVLFNNPVIKQGKKLAIVNELFDQRVSAITLLFLRFVARKNRAVNMRGISEAYLDMYRKANGIVASRLTTAVEPDGEVCDIAARVVAKSSGRTVELTSVVNPDIIGGFCLEFDSNMFDARISSRLADLRRSFQGNQYESKL